MESHWATDVGEDIEVRTRKKPEHQMFLKPSDKPGFRYVSVIGSFGLYLIKGWIESDFVFQRRNGCMTTMEPHPGLTGFLMMP